MPKPQTRNAAHIPRAEAQGFTPRVDNRYILQDQTFFVTIQVSFLLHRLRRRGEGEGRGHPAPRQGALQAPWNPLLNSYLSFGLE